MDFFDETEVIGGKNNRSIVSFRPTNFQFLYKARIFLENISNQNSGFSDPNCLLVSYCSLHNFSTPPFQSQKTETSCSLISVDAHRAEK